jgi:hypothetical protein
MENKQTLSDKVSSYSNKTVRLKRMKIRLKSKVSSPQKQKKLFVMNIRIFHQKDQLKRKRGVNLTRRGHIRRRIVCGITARMEKSRKHHQIEASDHFRKSEEQIHREEKNQNPNDQK